MKMLPIGIENFKELIDNKYYYVDKTALIKDVSSEKVALYTRPRRFGKTLNMSMLYYFFSNKEKENSYLFNGLEISKDKEACKHQNQYPVLFLTLKDMKRNHFEAQIDKFKSIISMLVDQYAELLDSPKLRESESKLLSEYLNEAAPVNKLMDALFNLSVFLEKHYEQKTIILIDE